MTCSDFCRVTGLRVRKVVKELYDKDGDDLFHILRKMVNYQTRMSDEYISLEEVKTLCTLLKVPDVAEKNLIKLFFNNLMSTT